MNVSYPKIGIIYLSYHSEPYLDDVVAALKALTYPKERVEFIVVDNPHPEHGPSVRAIEETLLPLSAKEIPRVTLLPQSTNIGFSAGNNIGIAWAIAHGCDYIFLHNNDGFFAGDAFEPLVEVMEGDRTIGAAQPLILLHPENELINSYGNMFHYLGFGFCGGYRLFARQATLPAVRTISYASGAAVLMRADLIQRYGNWDEDFFLYHEDLEYSFRLRMAGYRVVLVRDAIFYHKYQFGRSIMKYYWMERNRYAVLLMFFRIPTLLLLLPMLIVLELGLMVFALRGGWWNKRLDVYRYWCHSAHWRLWLGKRRRIQALRRVRDRDLLLDAAPGIYFQEKKMETKLLTHIGNPLMTLYYWVVVRGLIWW